MPTKSKNWFFFSAHTTAESVILATLLLTIQSFRRLYECRFVNVDSGSKMNLLHYVVGYVHYFCAGVGIFCEAPGLFRFGLRGFQFLSDQKNVHFNQLTTMIYFIVGSRVCTKFTFPFAGLQHMQKSFLPFLI
jgi:hypothetical protein